MSTEQQGFKFEVGEKVEVMLETELSWQTGSILDRKRVDEKPRYLVRIESQEYPQWASEDSISRERPPEDERMTEGDPVKLSPSPAPESTAAAAGVHRRPPRSITTEPCSYCDRGTDFWLCAHQGCTVHYHTIRMLFRHETCDIHDCPPSCLLCKQQKAGETMWNCPPSLIFVLPPRRHFLRFVFGAEKTK